MDKYILQKDTPVTSVGETWILKKGEVFEYRHPYYTNKVGWYYTKKFVENNPEWFKKEEPILPIGNTDKVFSYLDIWELIGKLNSLNINDYNKVYLKSFFFSEACKKYEPKEQQPEPIKVTNIRGWENGKWNGDIRYEIEFSTSSKIPSGNYQNIKSEVKGLIEKILNGKEEDKPQQQLTIQQLFDMFKNITVKNQYFELACSLRELEKQFVEK